jgi:Ca2+/Na+ antiporter
VVPVVVLRGEALAGDDEPAPRARALGHWLPIALVATLAALARQPEIAVGVLFATSVAAMSLVLGVVGLTADRAASSRAGGFPVIETDGGRAFAVRPDDVESASRERRAWGFLLPVAILCLIAGFRGSLQPQHGVALLLEALVILMLWRDARDGRQRAPSEAGLTRRAIELALATALALLTAFAAIRATRDVSDHIGVASALPVTAWMVAPSLVLPMIGSGMHVARRWNYSAVVSTSVCVTILNLCVALPLVIAIWNARGAPPRMLQTLAPVQVATTQPTTRASRGAAVVEEAAKPLPYPISVWRVDTVILVLLGLMLLPMSFGRWSPGRGDGYVLVFVYLAYMWLTAWVGRS